MSKSKKKNVKKNVEENHVLDIRFSWELVSILNDDKNDLLKIRTEEKVAKDIKTINLNGRIFAEVPDHGC